MKPISLCFTTGQNRRFFLIPDDRTPEPGSFSVKSLDGKTVSVSTGWLFPLEVSGEEARRIAKDQLAQTLDELKQGIDERLADLRRQLDEKDRTPVTENTTVAPNAAPALFDLLKKLPAVIGKCLSGDEKRVESAKTAMADFQRQLKEAGIDLDERFTNFPDRVADLRKDFEEQRAVRESATNARPSDKR